MQHVISETVRNDPEPRDTRRAWQMELTGSCQARPIDLDGGSAMPGYNAARPRAGRQSTAPKVLYRAEEAAEVMSLSRTAVFGLIRSGDLDTIKIGHRRRIPLSSIQDYVARQLAAGAESMS